MDGLIMVSSHHLLMFTVEEPLIPLDVVISPPVSSHLSSSLHLLVGYDVLRAWSPWLLFY